MLCPYEKSDNHEKNSHNINKIKLRSVAPNIQNIKFIVIFKKCYGTTEQRILLALTIHINRSAHPTKSHRHKRQGILRTGNFNNDFLYRF